MKIGTSRIQKLICEETPITVNGKPMTCENGDGVSVIHFDKRQLTLKTEMFDWSSASVWKDICDKVNAHFKIQ